MFVSAGLWGANALAQTPPATPLKSEHVSVTILDSPARLHFKKLGKSTPKEFMLKSKKAKQAGSFESLGNSSVATLSANENIQRLDEIRVLGNAEPEDYVALRPSPMLAFRAMLDAERPLTIAERLLAYCFICPKETPPEGNIVDRFDAKKFDRPIIIARPLGSLQ